MELKSAYETALELTKIALQNPHPDNLTVLNQAAAEHLADFIETLTSRLEKLENANQQN